MIVDTARIAAELLAPLLDSPEGEGVAVLHLDPDRRLLAAERVDPGEEAGLPVREILAQALRIGSASLIVARGRAGDDSALCREDRAAARRLVEAAAAVGVRLTDHLVFAAGECRSFRELGLL